MEENDFKVIDEYSFEKAQKAIQKDKKREER